LSAPRTGETENSDEWAEKARRLRSHGVVREAAHFSSESCSATLEHGPWYYEMQELGFNYRPSGLHCALGLSQLARLYAAYDGRFRGNLTSHSGTVGAEFRF